MVELQSQDYQKLLWGFTSMLILSGTYHVSNILQSASELVPSAVKRTGISSFQIIINSLGKQDGFLIGCVMFIVWEFYFDGQEVKYGPKMSVPEMAR